MTGHNTPEVSLVAMPSPETLFKLLDTVEAFDGGTIPESGTHKFITPKYLDTVGDIEFGERSVLSSIAVRYGRLDAQSESFWDAAWELRVAERHFIGSRIIQHTHHDFVWSDYTTSRSVRKIRVSNDYMPEDLYAQLDYIDNFDSEHLVLDSEQQMNHVSEADCEELMQRIAMIQQTNLRHDSLPTRHKGQN